MRKIKCHGRESILVKDLRVIIHEKTGIEPALQRLIYRAKKLEDDQALSNYGKQLEIS